MSPSVTPLNEQTGPPKPATRDPRPSKPSFRRRNSRVPVSTHVVLLIGVALFALPFYWLIVMATSSTTQIFTWPPRLIPGDRFFANFAQVLKGTQFGAAFFNSVWLTLTMTALQLFLGSLAGYTFAKRRFPGRNRLFAILLITLVVPTGVSLVPNYEIYAHLGWLNTFLPLIVPSAVTAFGVFWLRQSATSIPDEVVDAAAIDGAGFFRTFWSIGLPGMRPALIALGIFQAMWTWNDYIWPLLVLGKPSEYTLPIAIQALRGSYGSIDYSVVMAGSLVATVPLVVLFLVFRKAILENVGGGGAVKG